MRGREPVYPIFGVLLRASNSAGSEGPAAPPEGSCCGSLYRGRTRLPISRYIGVLMALQVAVRMYRYMSRQCAPTFCHDGSSASLL